MKKAICNYCARGIQSHGEECCEWGVGRHSFLYLGICLFNCAISEVGFSALLFSLCCLAISAFSQEQ